MAENNEIIEALDSCFDLYFGDNIYCFYCLVECNQFICDNCHSEFIKNFKYDEMMKEFSENVFKILNNNVFCNKCYVFSEILNDHFSDISFQRIKKEIENIKNLKRDYFKDEHIHIYETPYFNQYLCSIKGVESTPYENGTFFLMISFTNGYPLKNKPTVKFISKIFHPCVDIHGHINIDNIWILPAITIENFLILLRTSLFPIDSLPQLNHNVYTLYKTNINLFKKIAKYYTNTYNRITETINLITIV